MRADDAAQILLVRAIEESDPSLAVSPEADAVASAAVDGGDEAAWLLRRAAHRLATDLAACAALLHVAGAPRASALVLAVPFAVGLASNWLGPSAQIHVLYNPIAFLVAWNLALYAALILAPLALRKAPKAPRRPSQQASAASAQPASERSERTARQGRAESSGPAAERSPSGWLLRRVAPVFFFRVQRDVAERAAGARSAGRLARRFWVLWMDAAGPLVWTRAKRILHGGAAALAIGAVAGMFVRGVFFEYAMVWRSTFVRDPEIVATALRLVLGPAALLLGRALPSAADATAMLGEHGLPAAAWIWLWAATAALAIVVPRVLLVGLASLRTAALARRVEVSVDDAYFEQLLAGVRRAEIERIQTAIDTDVRAEIAQLVERIAGFVCVRLYDERLVPQLRAFRDTGGSIESLEAEMSLACESFEPELDAELDRARAALELGLRAAIERSVGRSLGDASASDVAMRPDDVPVGALGGAVGREISNAVGTAVSAGVGLVVATLSGGFGHHLGAALLVTLLHTTGPVGFLIGGLGGLAVAVAGWYFGRDRIASGMRGVALPRAVARVVLRDKALAKLVKQGRTQCDTAVREKLGAELAPLVPRLAEEIWSHLSRLPIGRRPPIRP